MKEILVPIENNDSFPSALACAWLLRQRLDARIEVCPIHSDVHPFSAMAAGMGGLSVRAEDLARNDPWPASAARTAFEGACHALEGSAPEAHCTFSERALSDEELAQRAKLFDLIVLGRPSGTPAGPRQTTVEAVLFESGRPIVIAPPDAPPAAPRTLGDVVAIAWNGSTETVRTMAFAAPLLERAVQVVVVSVDGGMVPGPSSSEVAATLRRRGVPAEARHLPCGRDVGDTILDACGEMGADLLLKGAFTRSRLRQLIFGGATQHILHHAPLPVFMAH